MVTIAYVYGHNDFFKNNFTFSSATDAKETLTSFNARADRVQAVVAEIGLNCYPQKFEVCDQNSMLGYMAYHGMPSHIEDPAIGSDAVEEFLDAGRPAHDLLAL